jgi:hypothetical protein
MAPFLFRCPNTGLHVQGWVADDGSDEPGETYETVNCQACRQMHLVNPRTGRVMRSEDE